MNDVWQLVIVTTLAVLAAFVLVRKYLWPRSSASAGPSSSCPNCASGNPCEPEPATNSVAMPGLSGSRGSARQPPR